MARGCRIPAVPRLLLVSREAPGHTLSISAPGAPFAMTYDSLDNEELLRLSLDAINNGRDADAVVMLKLLLERDHHHVYAIYLLAAQHAQLGMYDRAEAGFRTVVTSSPEFGIARFQLAQLLVMKGAADEAQRILAPLLGQSDALGAYARAMHAAADENLDVALRELEEGLALPQEIPALAMDMQRLVAQLHQGAGESVPPLVSTGVAPAPIFLTGYGREA